MVAGLADAGFDKQPKPIQTSSLSQIKSGADLFIILPEGSGKSTAMVIGVIQQLKAAFQEAPRAIIMAATKEKAFELEEQFALLAKHTDLRILTVFDQGMIQYHKDQIYEGLDILIGTPQRLNDLLKITGINMGELKMFVVDDVDSYTSDKYPLIYGVTDRIEKSQCILLANSWYKNFPELIERVMVNPIIVKEE